MTTRKIQIDTGRSRDSLSVRIADETSGETLAAFRLDQEQFFTMTGGGSLHLDAAMTDHLDRVGKTMVVDSEEVEARDLRASTYDQRVNDAVELVRADRPGWDEYSGRRTNRASVLVTMRKWV
jgi:hypothetical protein